MSAVGGVGGVGVGNVGHVGSVGNVGNVGWKAALQLGFAAEHGATRLARRAHRGPLAVQRPFLPEGPAVCHVYLLHPPGGLVGGDELAIDVDVDADAHALVTTPAAGKVYRTNGAPVRQTQRLRVAPLRRRGPADSGRGHGWLLRGAAGGAV